MVTQSENSSGAGAGAGGRPPQAAEASSPRTVIRGESSERGTPQSDGKRFGALTDYLNVTFRLPEWKDPAAGFFYRLTEAVGSAFGIMEDQGRGLHGYGHSCRFQRGGVRFAFGGQRCCRYRHKRHTWASWLTQAGVPLNALQEMGAWKSSQMVQRYAHLAPEQFQRYAATVDGLIGGGTNASQGASVAESKQA